MFENWNTSSNCYFVNILHLVITGSSFLLNYVKKISFVFPFHAAILYFFFPFCFIDLHEIDAQGYNQ